MSRYLVIRILSLFLVLIVVSVVTFTLMHSVPGGPFDEGEVPLPPAAKANIMRKYGLDKPMYVQYFNYMKNALMLDFGIPYQQPHTTVTALIAKSWRVTVQVGIMTVLLAFGVGTSLGLYAAYHQNSWIDNVATFGSMLGFTVPSFVVALWLILIFAVRLKWLPMGGWSGSGQCLIADQYFCTDWIMPVVAYALAPMAIIARYTRSSVVDVMRQDYARTAQAKGLRDRTIMFRHVFRNALIPMITALGVIIPNLLTGSIFIESIFRINGLGKFFVTSIFNRDYPMIMALFLLVALLWSVLYLLTDIAYTWIDPRVRSRGQGRQLVAGASAAAASHLLEQEENTKHRTLVQDGIRRFFRNRLAIFGLALVLFFVFLALFADIISPHPYDKVYFDRVLLFPFEHPAHPLGTDEVGRDYLSRLIYGARTSLFVGVSVMTLAVLIGVPLGGLAGYRGGTVDFLLSRVIDVMTAFPSILFAILLISVWGGGMNKVILALSITAWIEIARLTRGQLLSLREKEFVEAARASGASQSRIISRHLMPNSLTPLLVAVSFGIPVAMFAEAGLSFLGIGINDPFASWGKMVGVSNSYIRVYWHLALFPTIAIALAMLGFTFVGDGLRDALDPKMLE